jgi:hypothetical protein
MRRALRSGASGSYAAARHHPRRLADRLKLDDDEIVVLNHLNHALTKRADFEALVPDRADRQALHNLLCLLEREDPNVLDPGYGEHVQRARERLLPADE